MPCALVYTLHRREDDFVFAVSNTGDGLEYHPSTASPARGGAFSHMLTMQLEVEQPGTDNSLF